MGTTAKTLLTVALTLVIAAHALAHGIMHEPPHGEELKKPQLVDARIHNPFHDDYPGSGFEKTDSTQLCTTTGDPVFPVNGELRIRKVDLTVPSVGFPFSFVRCYKSGISYDGPLGQKWDFNFNSRLVLDTGPTPDTIERYDGAECRYDVFTKNATTSEFDAPSGIYEKIVSGSSGYELVDAHGGKLIFESCKTDGTKTYYRLAEIRDRNGRSMALTYDAGDATGKLTTVTDTNGRDFTFTYNANGRIEYIKDFGTTQRKIKFEYAGTNNDQLATVFELEGETLERKTTYTYDSTHHVLTITDPKESAKGSPVPFVRNFWSGNTVIAQEYGPSAASSSQETAYTWDYSQINGSPRRTIFVDRIGHQTTFFFDSAGLCTKKTYENGTNDVDELFYYDANKNCVTIAKGEGNVQTYTYDTSNSNLLARGNLLTASTKDSSYANALTTTYTYDSTYNQVSTVTQPTGRVDKFDYDANGNLTKKITDYGSTALNITTEFHYDATTKLMDWSQDPRSLRTSFEYNLLGYLTKTKGDTYGTGALNQTLSEFAYDEFGNLTLAKDGNANTTTIAVNRLNQVTQTTSPLGYDTKFYYDESDNLTKTEVENDSNVQGSGDFVVTMAYDLLDKLTSRTEDINSTTNRTTTYAFDAEDQLTLVTAPEGNQVKYEYNLLNLNTKATFGYGAAYATSYEYSFDKNFRLTQTREPKSASHVTTFAYDHHDRLTLTTNALGHTSKSTYSGARLIATESFASGSGTALCHKEFEYDTADRLILTAVQMKLSPGGTDIGDGENNSQIEYDLAGNVTKTRDDQNHATTMTYDTLNRLTIVEDAKGNQTKLYYDLAHNITKREEVEVIAAGGTETFTYLMYFDTENRLTKSKDPANKETLFGYGARNLLTITDPNGFTTESIRNEQGWLVESRAQKSADATLNSKWEFDKNGRLTKIKDPRDYATTYAYDQADRQTSQTFNDTYSIAYVYDTNSNIITRTDQNGTVVAYGYDLANRMTRKDITAGAAHIGGEVSHKIFSYDALNRLTYAEDTDSKIYYTYNTASLVETEEMRYGALNLGATGKTVEWDYNAQGLVTNVRYPGATSTSGQLNYTYDVNNRLTEIKRQTGASTTESLAVWTYRGAGRIEKRLNGNDTYLEATFDSRKLVSTLVHKHIESPSDQKLAEFAYGYDDAARMSTEAIKVYNDSGTLIADNGLGFFYDRAARLTKLYRDVPQADLGADPPTNYGQKVEYALDDNSNRISAVYTPKGGSASTEVYTSNNTNAYTNVDWPGPTDTDYEYDKAGNRTWQTDTDRSWYYDYQNKLVKVENGSLNYCEYDYDALGRRMQKHFQYDGIDYDTTTRFYYAGAMLIQEWNVVFEGEGAEMTESSEREFEYVWGLSATEPVQLLKYELGTGSLIESVYYHQSALASVYAITKDSANAEIRENYRYEEYGVPTINATDTNTAATALWGNKLLWRCQYYDFEVVNLSSGLSLFHDKMQGGYDPEVASFLCRDSHTTSAAAPWMRGSSLTMNRNSRGRTAASTGASVGKLGAVATGGMTGISSANSGRKVPGSDDGYRGPQGDPGGDGFHASGRGNPVFRREDSVYGGPRRPGVLSGLGSTFSQFSSGVNLVLDDKRPSSLSLPFGVGGVVDADSTGDSPSSGRGGSGTGLDPLYFLLLLFLGHDKAYIASSLRDIAYGRAEQYSIEKAGGVSDVAAIGAIRHFLWGYYMAKKFGSAVLSILCDVLRETFTVALIPSKQQDSLADLHNTALGATYGTSDAEAAGESPEEIAFRLLQDGELYSNGADQTPKAAQVAVPSDAFLSRGCLRPFFYTNARMPGSFGDGSALDELSRRENSISKMLEERIQRQRDKR